MKWPQKYSMQTLIDKAYVMTLILGKVDFKKKSIIRANEGYIIIIKARFNRKT